MSRNTYDILGPMLTKNYKNPNIENRKTLQYLDRLVADYKDENVLSKEYIINAIEGYSDGIRELKEFDKAFEAFYKTDKLSYYFEVGYEDYDPYSFSAENEGKENFFIRVWRKFVAVIKKIFGNIIKFFKFIIGKIVQFVKWLIGKLFKKKKSGAEIKRASNMFDKYKNKPFKDNKRSQEAIDFSLIFNKEVLEDLAICDLKDEDLLAKINRLIGITSAFIEGANKIMRQQIEIDKVFTFQFTQTGSSFRDVHSKKENYLEHTDTTLSRIVTDYITKINHMSVFPVYKNLMDNDDAIVKINGKLIAQACFCDESITNFEQLEKRRKNININCIEDVISKDLFVNVYSMPDDYKKEWEEENREMIDYCDALEKTLKSYNNLVENKTKEFEKLKNPMELDDENERKEYANALKNYYNIIRKQTQVCSNICTQAIQTTKYIFQFRININTIVNNIVSYFKKEDKIVLQEANKGTEIQTLYGPLPIYVFPESDYKKDGKAIKGDGNFANKLIELSKNCLSFLLGGKKIVTKKLDNKGISFSCDKNIIDGANGYYITNDPDKPGDEKNYIQIVINSDLFFIYDHDHIKGFDESLPIEIHIATVVIHETVHAFQAAKLNKNSILNKKEIGYGSKKGTYEKSAYTDRLSDGDNYKKQKILNHINNTTYAAHLTEINANKVAYKFAINAVKKIDKLDNATFEVFKHYLKRVNMWDEIREYQIENKK